MSRLHPAVFVVVLSVTAPAYQDSTPPTATPLSQVTLHDGQEVVLRNIDPISSNHSKPGEVVQFEVIRDVDSEGLVVIPQHSIAIGSVMDAKHAQLVHHGGKLAVAIESVRLANGSYARLRALDTRKERNFGWQEVGAATAIAATIYYMPLAPVYLMAKGEDVSIAPGSRFTAFVDGDVTVDRQSLEAVVPIPETNPNLATIVVFRGNSDRQPDFEQPVSCGRVLIGSLTDTTYVQFAVTPGQYWVYAYPPDIKLTPAQQTSRMVALNAEAGKTYYLEAAVVRGKWGVNFSTLQAADETAGKEAVFNSALGTELPPTQTLNNPQLGARPRGVKAN
jgi:hypothetical protein